MERKKINPEELDEILRKHRLWLSYEDGGERGSPQRAVPSGAVINQEGGCNK